MKKYVILLIIIAGIWNCDSFLDVRPKSEVVEDKFFSTREGFEDGLYGVYATLGKASLYGKTMTWLVPDILAQYYSVTSQASTTYYNISTFEHQSTYVREIYNGMWNSMYEAVGYVNNVINNLELKDAGSLKYYDLYKGEALGTRAFLHFDLVRLYAPHVTSKPDARGVPYVKNYVSLVTPFSTVQEVYKVVISELKQAERLLVMDQDFLTFPRNRKIEDGFPSCRELHFNLYAAQAMLARVYWMKGDLDSAYVYARKVIDSGKFPLVNKTKVDRFMAGIVTDGETIWGLASESFFDNVKVSFYDAAFMGIGNLFPTPEYISLCKASLDEGTEYRQDWVRTKLNDTEMPPKKRLLKILNEDKALNREEPKALIAGINLLRIPEMYLIAAEALLTKDPSMARVYFDTFIESRGLIGLANRQPARVLVLDDILRERRKEFIAEGQEWFNMKRLNQDIYNPNTLTVTPGSDKVYTILIPDEEFEFRDEEI